MGKDSLDLLLSKESKKENVLDRNIHSVKDE